MEYSEKRKSRDQELYEYFITLQKEYIVAEIRKKIYPDIKGKKKSIEIMEGKRIKICDIAAKNSLKTIFPELVMGNASLYDEDLRFNLYREVYGDFGLPNFIYRDEVQEQKLAWKDRKYYFMIGAEIRTIDGHIGSIQYVDLDKGEVYAKVRGDIKMYGLNEVSRIL